MKHVIITGGAGFIGSHLCDTFLEKGYAVTVLDNLVTGRIENLKSAQSNRQFEWIECDVSEGIPEEKISFLKAYGLEGILHFACPASPVDFEKIPFEILKVDSLGTMHTVDLCLRNNAKYVLASTSEVYGDPLEHPQKETYWGNVNSVGPRACYDETKRFAEAYVSAAISGTGLYRGKAYTPLNGRIVRIFNTYGPRMRPDDGRVVPEFCIRALQRQSIPVHGDGSQTRSFCHVSDLVRGIYLLYQSDIREPVNLGNPDERTILDFAQAICRLTGKGSKIENLPSREDDPRQRCPDISRAKEKLSWQPQVDLDQGLKETLEDFQKGLE